LKSLAKKDLNAIIAGANPRFKIFHITMDNMKNFVEKYRPHTIEDVYLEEKNKVSIHNFISTKNFPNLLFYGPSGTGKTSTIIAMAKMIYKEKYNLMVLELNASDNRNIQVVRKIIKEFASCKTLFNNGYKLIILDEVDSMTNDAQFCLRRIMEAYSENVRFCFICNFVGKIIPAIQSRCSKFKFSSLDIFQIRERLDKIMLEEDIQINDDVMNMIMTHSRGDMRKILNYIQLFKYHKCRENIDDYYSLLRIPNVSYIKVFFEKMMVNDGNIYEYYIEGVRKGYYDIEIFCQTLYKILLESFDKIGETRFIRIIQKLTLIDKKPEKILNNAAFIDMLVNA
jgi:replication factor C subunit 3/5